MRWNNFYDIILKTKKGIDYENYKTRSKQNIVWIVADYWVVELLGYDVVENKIRNQHFYDNVLKEIDDLLFNVIPLNFKYGIKWMIDGERGWFVYEVSPIEERLKEFVVAELKKNMTLAFIEGLLSNEL